MKNPFKPGSPSFIKFEQASPEIKNKIVAAIGGQAKNPGGANLAQLAKDKLVDKAKDKVLNEVLPSGTMGPTPGYIPAAVVASTAAAGKAGLDMLKGETPGTPGRAQLGIATGGLSEIANLMGFGGILGHKSTKDIQKEHTQELRGQGADNAAWQAYVAGARQQHENGGPPDPSKPFFNGKYESFDEYKKAGLDAADLEGVHGNLSTFGPDWAGYSPEQRKAITQSLIDNNMYESKKGEVEVTDAAKAKEIGLAALAPKAQEASKGLPEGTRLAPDGVNRITDMPGIGEVSTLIGVPDKNASLAKLFEGTNGLEDLMKNKDRFKGINIFGG